MSIWISIIILTARTSQNIPKIIMTSIVLSATKPAKLIVAMPTCHMIASIIFLDVVVAFRTFVNRIFIYCLFKTLIQSLFTR